MLLFILEIMLINLPFAMWKMKEYDKQYCEELEDILK